ncbi:hypothetical protein LTS06_012484 [Exophiala xenobiotica]|nr:hypothetical protein LTS06_012484 [Exophiala xenobiotica]
MSSTSMKTSRASRCPMQCQPLTRNRSYWPYPIDPNHTEYNFELAGIQITHPINGQTTHFYVSKLAAKIGTERINTKFSQVAKKAFLQSSAGTFATAGLEGTGAKAT